MIILTILQEHGQPFPRREIEYDSEYDIVKDHGLTLREIRRGLETGELVLKKFIFRFSPDFIQTLEAEFGEARAEICEMVRFALNDTAIEQIVEEYGGSVPRSAIQTILGMTKSSVDRHISKACRKIAAHPEGRSFFYNVQEYRERRNNEIPFGKIVARTKIKITIEEE